LFSQRLSVEYPKSAHPQSTAKMTSYARPRPQLKSARVHVQGCTRPARSLSVGIKSVRRTPTCFHQSDTLVKRFAPGGTLKSIGGRCLWFSHAREIELR
jgi:hypothetical protein